MKTYSLDYLDDLPSARQRQLTQRDKADDIARSRFWPDVAVELTKHRKHRKYAVRLAALVFVVAVKTAKKHRQGALGYKSGWNASAKQWAKWIGLTSRHAVYDLLDNAKTARLLNWQRTRTGMLVWLHKTSLYSRIKVDEYGRVYDYGDTHYFNHHDHRLSLAAGIIVDKIKYYSERHDDRVQHKQKEDDDYQPPPPEGVRRNAEGWRQWLPYFSHESIKKALHFIRKKKLAKTDEERIWWLNVKAYTKFMAKKAGGSRTYIKVPEPTSEVPEATSEVPEATCKSPYQHHNNAGAMVASLATLEESTSPSPTPAASKPPAVVPPSAVSDERQVSLRFFISEDDRYLKRKDRWKIPVEEEEEKQAEITPVLKQADEKPKHVSGDKAKSVPKAEGRPKDISSVKGTAAVPQAQQAEGKLKHVSSVKGAARAPQAQEADWLKSMGQQLKQEQAAMSPGTAQEMLDQHEEEDTQAYAGREESYFGIHFNEP